MANMSVFQKCDICDNLTHIKIQAGYVSELPFSYQCPSCGIPIKGRFELNPDKGIVSLKESLNSSTLNGLHQSDFLLQLSAEFYVNKMMDKKRFDVMPAMSPFMEFALQMDVSYMIDLVTEINNILPSRKMKFKRMIHLLLNNRTNKLYKDMKKENIFNKRLKHKNFIRLNRTEIIENITLFGFEPILISKKYTDYKEYLSKMFNQAKHEDYEGLLVLRDIYKERFMEDILQLTKIMNSFTTYYFLIFPVVINEIEGSIKIDDIKRNKGISQTDFETIKSYYVENFEIITNFSSLIVGLQNILNRGSINDFHPKVVERFGNAYKDGLTIEVFDRNFNKKGNRVFVMSCEDNLLSLSPDSLAVLCPSIRNSIGHEDYIYKQNEQIIKFTNGSDPFEIYFIEFAKSLWDGFLISHYLTYLISRLYDL